MNLLALDPGTLHLGWAVFRDDGPARWGVISADGARYEERLLVLRDAVEDLVAVHEVTDLCWERVPPAGRGRYDTNALLLRALDVALRRWAATWCLPWACYLPNVIRAGIIGGGFRHADGDPKAQVKAAILLRWPRARIPSDLPSHVYDAIAVGDYHLGELRLLARITDPFERMRHLDRMHGTRRRGAKA